MGGRSPCGRTGEGEQAVRGQLGEEVGVESVRNGAGTAGWGLTCIPKALMAMEMGPFLASQAASSETGEGQHQGRPGPRAT